MDRKAKSCLNPFVCFVCLAHFAVKEGIAKKMSHERSERAVQFVVLFSWPRVTNGTMAIDVRAKT